MAGSACTSCASFRTRDLRDHGALRRGQRRLLRDAREAEPPRREFLIVDDPTNLARATGCSSRRAAHRVPRGIRRDALVLRAALEAGCAGGPRSRRSRLPPTGGGAVATQLTNAVAAGDDQILLDDPTGMTAGRGDFSIGAGNTLEFVVTATADPRTTPCPSTSPRRWPSTTPRPSRRRPHGCDPGAGAQLAAAAPAGALADRRGRPDAARRCGRGRVRAGHADRVLTIGDLGIVGLPTGLRFRHAAGTSVVTPTLTDIGAATARPWPTRRSATRRSESPSVTTSRSGCCSC